MSRRLILALLVPAVLVATVGVPWMQFRAAEAELESALNVVTDQLPDPAFAEMKSSEEHASVRFREELGEWHARLVAEWPEAESFAVLKDANPKRWSEVAQLRAELSDTVDSIPANSAAVVAPRPLTYTSNLLPVRSAFNAICAEAHHAAKLGLFDESHAHLKRAFRLAKTFRDGSASGADFMISIVGDGIAIRQTIELAQQFPSFAQSATRRYHEEFLGVDDDANLMRVARIDLRAQLAEHRSANDDSPGFEWRDLGRSGCVAMEENRAELEWLAQCLQNSEHDIDCKFDAPKSWSSVMRWNFAHCRRVARHTEFYRRHNYVMLAILEAKANGRTIESLDELSCSPVILASSRVATAEDGSFRNLVVAEPYASRFGLTSDHTTFRMP